MMELLSEHWKFFCVFVWLFLFGMKFETALLSFYVNGICKRYWLDSEDWDI